MKHLEDELREAMRREEPPAGFTNRVLAAASGTRTNPWTRIFGWSGVRWALAGAMCLMLAVAGIEYKQRRDEQERGEAAKAQLMQALRITADKLEFAQATIQKHTAGLSY